MLKAENSPPLEDAEREGMRRLMAAVLQDGIQTLRRCVGQRTNVERTLYAEAMAWIHSQDMTYFFSFENICLMLGLDSGTMRYQLRRHGLVKLYSVDVLNEPMRDAERIGLAREVCIECKQSRKAVDRTASGEPICSFCKRKAEGKPTRRYEDCQSCGQGPRELSLNKSAGIFWCGSCRKRPVRIQSTPQEERIAIGG